MKNTLKKFFKSLPGAVLIWAAIGVSWLSLVTVLESPKADAQNVATGPTMASSGMVTPRTYTLISNFLLTNIQGLESMTLTNTNLFSALLGPSWPTSLTNQGVYVEAPTLLAAGAIHEIGLWCVVSNSNGFVANSNLIVTVYPAYDLTGGSQNTIAGRYGQLFSTNAILTWTISFSNGCGTFGTNISVPLWCPATALGYTISNTTKSNIVASLYQTDVP
jgi:hypothetical protein